jgi:hypothetical protein
MAKRSQFYCKNSVAYNPPPSRHPSGNAGAIALLSDASGVSLLQLLADQSSSLSANGNRIDVKPAPPCSFITGAMKLASLCVSTVSIVCGRTGDLQLDALQVDRRKLRPPEWGTVVLSRVRAHRHGRC